MIKNVEQQLVDLRAGKETSLSFFMDQYAHSLRFFALKMIKDRLIAEEIISDAYVKLWDRKENFHCEETVKSFLYLVTKNACLDFIKSGRNKVQHEEEWLYDLENPDKDILTKMIYFELIELIVQEIEKLPKQQAQIFKMSYFDGKDTGEISEALGTSASNIYFARSRAISMLKQVFKQKDISFYSLLIAFLANNY